MAEQGGKMELLAPVTCVQNSTKQGARVEGEFEVLFEDDLLPAPYSQHLLSPHEAVSSRRAGTTSDLPTIFFAGPSMMLCLTYSKDLSHVYCM